MNKRHLKNAEWSILICTFCLIIIGLVAQYSATLSSDLSDFKKQLTWLAASIPIFVIIIFLDYKIIARCSLVLYIGTILLLVAVLFTSAVNGARSWFSIGSVSIQPGEFGKIAVVLMLAMVISNVNRLDYKEINKPIKLIGIIGICLLPVLLIVIQPDYGTAISYIVALIFMLFVAGIDRKYIVVSIFAIPADSEKIIPLPSWCACPELPDLLR